MLVNTALINATFLITNVKALQINKSLVLDIMLVRKLVKQLQQQVRNVFGNQINVFKLINV